MEQREQPIGVFDSGLGGISVLRACTALLPQENFLFFGDSANAPYGEKSLTQVRRLTIAAVSRLLAQGVKAVVVACNTATSAAIHLLRQAHPGLPIIGIEPAVKPAALDVGSSSVIVMATPLTIREDKYQKLAAAFCHEANVISLPCPGLAEMVEGGLFDGPVLDGYLQDALPPLSLLQCGLHRPGVHPLPLRPPGHRPEFRPAGGHHRWQRRHRPAAAPAAGRPGPPLPAAEAGHRHFSKQPAG